jgi:hypothetical protein
MNQILLFLLLLFCTGSLYSQQKQTLHNPDLWFKPAQVNNQMFIQVIKPDTVFYLDMNLSDTLVNYHPAFIWENASALRVPHQNSGHFEQSVFAVYHSKDSLNEYGIWSLERDSNWYSSQTTHRFVKSTGAVEYRYGGMDLPVVNTCLQSWPKSRFPDREHHFILGQSRIDSTYVPFAGFLAECLVYGQSPNRKQTAKIQTYLALKYGITLHKSDYVSPSDSVIWNYDSLSRYSHGIAGFGKDSLSGLDQRQSCSTSEPQFLSIAAGQLSRRNMDNLTTLVQNDYLLWGHDSFGLHAEGSGSDLYPYAHPLLERKWLIRPYGNMRRTPTEVVIRANELPDSTGPFQLVIDRSGTGNFTSVFTEYIPSDSVSTYNEVFFRNIYWDSDSSGSDLFTFSVGSALICDVQHPSCINTHDGKLTIELSGGASPYRYTLTHTGNNQCRQWQSSQRIQEVENLSIGDYTLEAFDSENRCWKKENILLTSSLPETFGLPCTYHIVQGDTLTLDVRITEADSLYSYTWKKDNVIFNQTSHAQLTQAGRYEISVSNAHGCTTIETIQVVTDTDELFPCEIYPNPTTGPYEIRVTLPEIMEVHVRVYNINGVFLLNRTASGSREYRFMGYMNGTGRYLVDVQTPIGRRQLVMIVKR